MGPSGQIEIVDRRPPGDSPWVKELSPRDKVMPDPPIGLLLPLVLFVFRVAVVKSYVALSGGLAKSDVACGVGCGAVW